MLEDNACKMGDDGNSIRNPGDLYPFRLAKCHKKFTSNCDAATETQLAECAPWAPCNSGQQTASAGGGGGSHFHQKFSFCIKTHHFPCLSKHRLILHFDENVSFSLGPNLHFPQKPSP